MPRAGLTTERVVEAAAQLADSEGLDRLSLAALSTRLGVKPPSLYVHVGGLEDLRERIAARGAEQLAEELGAAAAGRTRSEALAAIAHRYRGYARSHPGSYAALQFAPERNGTAAGPAARLVEIVLAVLGGYGLHGDRALHATRVVRASLHGFVLLEAQQGFGLPLDLDQSFEKMIEMLDAGLAAA